MATSINSDTKTELTDSLLHSNIRRVITGIFCGIASGLVLLGLSTIFTAPGAGKLWWLQLMGSAIYGGDSFAYEAATQVYIAGLVIHLVVSAFCGFLMGKMTTSKSVVRLGTYGLVLGGLCWLASNMFAPDLFNVQVLSSVGEWVRVALFIPFGILVGVFLGIAG